MRVIRAARKRTILNRRLRKDQATYSARRLPRPTLSTDAQVGPPPELRLAHRNLSEKDTHRWAYADGSAS